MEIIEFNSPYLNKPSFNDQLAYRKTNFEYLQRHCLDEKRGCPCSWRFFSSYKEGDYWDYRGIATEREISLLKEGVVSLGRYLHPTKGEREKFFLSAELLCRNCAIVGLPG